MRGIQDFNGLVNKGCAPKILVKCKTQIELRTALLLINDKKIDRDFSSDSNRKMGKIKTNAALIRTVRHEILVSRKTPIGIAHSLSNDIW